MSDSRAAPTAAVLGALAVAAIPVGVLAAWVLGGAGLLGAIEVAVPVALALGLAAVAVARRAQSRVERSVLRARENLVRVARLLAWGSLFLAASGAIALGFYGLLVLRG